MVDDLLGGAAALLSGGAGGWLGAVGSRVVGFFEKKQELKRLELEQAHELKLLELKKVERQIEREHENSIAFDQSYSQRLVGSYEQDASYGESLLRWVRPVLTFGLLLFTGFYAYTTSDSELQKSIALGLLGYTGMAISWWFADRSMNHAKK